MKEMILNKAKNIIIESNRHIDDTKLEEIMYGLEGLYLTFYKLIIILLISIFLKIFKEVVIFLLLFNIIRFFAFGVHAKNSITCLISSSIIFIFIPLMCKVLVINNFIKFILAVSNIILIISYAPADTTKRPIISKNFRKFYKIMSLLVAITFNILSFCIKDTFLSNSLLLSILTEAIMICPFTYKLFKVPYNNYLNFNFEA